MSVNGSIRLVYVVYRFNYFNGGVLFCSKHHINFHTFWNHDILTGFESDLHSKIVYGTNRDGHPHNLTHDICFGSLQTTLDPRTCLIQSFSSLHMHHKIMGVNVTTLSFPSL